MLPVGSYKVCASSLGFEQVCQNVVIGAGTTTAFEAILRPVSVKIVDGIQGVSLEVPTVAAQISVACFCDENTVCLSDAQMARHAIHIEMEADRMGNHSNYEGIAVFQIRFDEKGRVTGADTISGNPFGVSYLMAAVPKWRFRPVVVNGARKKACGKLSVKFAMKENVPSVKVVKHE